MRVKAVVPQQRPKLNDLLQMLFTVSLVRDKNFPCVEKNTQHTWKSGSNHLKTKHVQHMKPCTVFVLLKWPYNNCYTQQIKLLLLFF